MGQVGQLALGIVGAVIGGYFGGPAGAQAGFMAGAFIGGLIFPTKIKGPNPTDLKVQTSAYGKHVPIVYGMYRMAGNVIWMSQPTKVSHDQGGKGGPSATTYSYSVSLAVGLCEGPIQGVRRVWANGTLIYDVSTAGGFLQAISSASAGLSMTVYLGDEAQLPDPTIQADKGVANTPAFRGLAYVVINNFDLQNYGNYVPSFEFEIINGAGTQWNTVQSALFTGQSGSPMYGAVNYITGTTGYGFTTVANAFIPTPVAWGRVDQYGATAYGTATTPNPKDEDSGGPWYGYADQPGLVSRYTDPSLGLIAGWLDGNSPAPTYQPLFNIPAFNGAFQSPMFIKSGTDFYATTTNDAYYPFAIYRGSSLSNLISATTTVNGTWKLLGITASYLYAMDGGGQTGTPRICRFDRNTLALIATVGTLSGTVTDFGCCGCVVNDSTIYYILAGHIWRLDTSTGASTQICNAPTTPGYIASMAVISPTCFVFGSGVSSTGIGLTYVYMTYGDSKVTVSSILADVCTRAGLSPSQYDVSGVTALTYGYAITNHTDGRNNIAPLLAAYFIDVSDTSGKLKFVSRGNAPAVTIPYTDLGYSQSMSSEEAQNPIKETIAQELDLPAEMTLTYVEYNSDYQPNTQGYERLGTHARKITANNYPLVLTGNEAVGIVQSMMLSEWLGRQTFQFSTSLAYITYEPSDVIYLTADDGSVYLARLLSCEFDGQGVLKWAAVAEEPTIYPNPATYTPLGGAPSGFVPQVMGYYGQTVLDVLDVPPLRNSDTSPGVYLATCGLQTNWRGCNVLFSRDGNSYAQLESWFKAATMGVTQTALPAWTGGNIPDERNVLTVQLYNGTLSSVSYSDFLNQANAAVVGSEIVFFRTATLISAGVYQLSGLLRGRVGTEWAMSSHVVGEKFVFLDANTLFLNAINANDVKSTLYFEAATITPTKPITGAPVKQTVTEACVRPLSPAYFGAFSGSASSVNDISLSWFRRARVNAQWLNGADVPLDESVESYQLTISNASGVPVRTVTVTAATSYTYTAAQITADGFTTGNTINFSVAQNSDQGVTGHASTASIVR